MLPRKLERTVANEKKQARVRFALSNEVLQWFGYIRQNHQLYSLDRRFRDHAKWESAYLMG